MRPVVDHTGRKYGSLTVLGHARQEGGVSFWRVRCECGRECEKRACNLAKLQGCSRGCPTRCQHFLKSPLYTTWVGVKNRCENPNTRNWRWYGGRGIYVCERWATSFANFLEDMGPSHRKGLQLDRRDNDGPYSPENCQWVTREENHRKMVETVRRKKCA